MLRRRENGRHHFSTPTTTHAGAKNDVHDAGNEVWDEAGDETVEANEGWAREEAKQDALRRTAGGPVSAGADQLLDADNTAADAVGTNDATLINGATYASGQINQAFCFDGIDDRVQVADSPSLKLTESLTIEAWVRADSVPIPGGVILFRGDDRGGLDPYVLDVLENGTVRFMVTSLAESTAESTSVSTRIPLGQFVQVAGTLDDATGAMRLYLNGVLMSQATTTVRPFGDLDLGC